MFLNVWAKWDFMLTHELTWLPFLGHACNSIFIGSVLIGAKSNRHLSVVCKVLQFN